MNNLRSSSSRSQMSSKSDNTVNKEEISLTNVSSENNWQDWKLPLVPQNFLYIFTFYFIFIIWYYHPKTHIPLSTLWVSHHSPSICFLIYKATSLSMSKCLHLVSGHCPLKFWSYQICCCISNETNIYIYFYYIIVNIIKNTITVNSCKSYIT